MFLLGHIYEINDDNAGQVSQTELAGRPAVSLQVDFQYRILGILFAGIFSCVNVDDSQGPPSAL